MENFFAATTEPEVALAVQEARSLPHVVIDPPIAHPFAKGVVLPLVPVGPPAGDPARVAVERDVTLASARRSETFERSSAEARAMMTAVLAAAVRRLFVGHAGGGFSPWDPGSQNPARGEEPEDRSAYAEASEPMAMAFGPDDSLVFDVGASFVVLPHRGGATRPVASRGTALVTVLGSSAIVRAHGELTLFALDLRDGTWSRATRPSWPFVIAHRDRMGIALAREDGAAARIWSSEQAPMVLSPDLRWLDVGGDTYDTRAVTLHAPEARPSESRAVLQAKARRATQAIARYGPHLLSLTGWDDHWVLYRDGDPVHVVDGLDEAPRLASFDADAERLALLDAAGFVTVLDVRPVLAGSGEAVVVAERDVARAMGASEPPVTRH